MFDLPGTAPFSVGSHADDRDLVYQKCHVAEEIGLGDPWDSGLPIADMLSEDSLLATSSTPWSDSFVDPKLVVGLPEQRFWPKRVLS